MEGILSDIPRAERAMAEAADVRQSPTAPANLLFASYFTDADDEKGYGHDTRKLFHKVYGLRGHRTMYAAHNAPGAEATIPRVRGMTTRPGEPTTAFVAFAHGSLERSAAILGLPDPKTKAFRHGRPWQGGDIDLHRVEFLLLICCAIGRLEGGAGRTVEGFAARLLTAGGLSTMAARWSIEVGAAAKIAEEVLRLYLEARAKVTDTTAPLADYRIRARALRQARVNFGHRPELLNVLAALEVYGQG